MILLDPKIIMRFIVDVTNAPDKEYLSDITKTLITGKAILTESELELVRNSRRNSTWLFMAWNNSVYGFHYVYYANIITYIYKQT